MQKKVAINGFGRIGRNVVRAWLETQQSFDFDIIAINDIAEPATLNHLFCYDSTHGRFLGNTSLCHDQLHIHQNGRTLTLHTSQYTHPKDTRWKELDIDIVLECTGLFRSKADASQHLSTGAKQVIIGAAPFDEVDIAVVYGVNHQDILPHHQLISGVSCTTQALVPLIQLLDETVGIHSALMTEIHAVTADQSVLDQAHRDLRRARASGHNIIPTTSSAIGALHQVLPNMANKIIGYSVRVPTINVAMIDLSFVAKTDLDTNTLNDILTQASLGKYRTIMSTTNKPLVSSDFNHLPYSLITDLTQTLCVGRHAKVVAWYDNEWGYANRLLDLCQTLSTLP